MQSPVMNSGAAGYYRTAYEAAALADLTRRLPRISELERVLLASDSWALVQSGHYDIGASLALSEALAADRTSGVLYTVAGSLRYIDSHLASDGSAPVFRAWVARTFKPLLNELTWSKTKSEPDNRTELRAVAAELVAGIGHDGEARAKARSLVMEYLARPESLDGTLAATLVPLVAEDGDAAMYDAFLAKRNAAAAPEDRDRFLYALGEFTDPALVKRTIDLALSTDVRRQDSALLISRALRGPVGRKLVWPMVRDRWTDVVNHIDSSFGPGSVVSALGNLCDDEAATELDQFFKTHEARGAARSLQQALEQIRTCAALKAAQASRLAEWLANRK
jgi:aminopeptidase N